MLAVILGKSSKSAPHEGIMDSQNIIELKICFFFPFPSPAPSTFFGCKVSRYDAFYKCDELT